MRDKVLQWARENRGFALFMLLMLVFRSAFADWNTVPTGSMKPTIVEGDRILVNKMAYDVRVPFTHLSLQKLADPQRGEVVVFDSAAADTRLVKRMIGLPGDTVALKDNVLVVNGVPARYSQVKAESGFVSALENWNGSSRRVRFAPGGVGPHSSFGPVRVPEGHYLVLGDNRDNSADSRFIGFVPRDEFVGRARTVVMSLDYDHYYLPRGDRFLHTL